jgi:hypothetical protein
MDVGEKGVPISKRKHCGDGIIPYLNFAGSYVNEHMQ